MFFRHFASLCFKCFQLFQIYILIVSCGCCTAVSHSNPQQHWHHSKITDDDMKQRRGLSEFWSTDTISKGEFFWKTGEPKDKVLAPSRVDNACIASVSLTEEKKCCFGLTLKILARIDDLPGRDLEVCWTLSANLVHIWLLIDGHIQVGHTGVGTVIV